ncbi:fibronectin type III-like domain-contianing protein [Escherichia coli]
MKLTGALYPFGYGLSYTTFTVSDVKLSAPTMKRDGKVTASVQVTNTGKREGATVVQMYLQDVTASMSRPVKQLKGFEKSPQTGRNSDCQLPDRY